MVPPRHSASQRIIVMKLLHDALVIADQAKPASRQPLDKLRFNQFSAGVTELSKRFAGLADDIAGLRKSLEQMRADLDHMENRPGEKREIIN